MLTNSVAFVSYSFDSKLLAKFNRASRQFFSFLFIQANLYIPYRDADLGDNLHDNVSSIYNFCARIKFDVHISNNISFTKINPTPRSLAYLRFRLSLSLPRPRRKDGGRFNCARARARPLGDISRAFMRDGERRTRSFDCGK